MKTKLLIVPISLVFSFFAVSCNQENESFYTDLAYHYAPIHYQETDSENPKADYITKCDYDNDWIADNNWENLYKGDLSAYVYYSVCETETHWFIVYAFFHPRDWDNGSFTQEHENDMEGILLTVKKDDSEFGTIQTMLTIVHTNFNSYIASNSSITGDHDKSIDGTITTKMYDGSRHPITDQNSKGHPCFAYPYSTGFTSSKGRGIVYYPSKTISELPDSGTDDSVKYKLINLNEFGNLWTLQLINATDLSNSTMYYSWGNLKGNDDDADATIDDCGDGITATCGEHSANTPWNWDTDDGGELRGEFALHPAHLVAYYFKGLGEFSSIYTRNKYLSDLKEQGFTDTYKPTNFPEQLNLTTLYSNLND